MGAGAAARLAATGSGVLLLALFPLLLVLGFLGVWFVRFVLDVFSLPGADVPLAPACVMEGCELCGVTVVGISAAAAVGATLLLGMIVRAGLVLLSRLEERRDCELLLCRLPGPPGDRLAGCRGVLLKLALLRLHMACWLSVEAIGLVCGRCAVATVGGCGTAAGRSPTRPLDAEMVLLFMSLALFSLLLLFLLVALLFPGLLEGLAAGAALAPLDSEPRMALMVRPSRGAEGWWPAPLS